MALNWKSGILLQEDPQAEAAAGAKIDPELRPLIEKNDTDEIENRVLTRIDTSPTDLRYLVPVIRHFTRSRTPDKAELLFKFILEAYQQRSLQQEEISLLRAVLRAWPESRLARQTLLERFASCYSDIPDFGRLAGHCKVTDDPDPFASFKRLESWLRFPVGRGVYLASKGVGRVKEINPSMNAIRVLFSGEISPMTFKPDEALRLLEPLDTGHFLLDKLERIDELRQLEAPVLLERLFRSMEKPLTVAEVKALLAGIIPAQKWSSWWNGAKKDRRLTVGKDNVCVWNDSAEDADALLLAGFLTAAPRQKMEMTKKHGKRSAALMEKMTTELLCEAHRIAADDPAVALELFLSIDGKLSETDASEKSRTLGEILRRSDIETLIAGMSDRNLRKKAVSLLKEENEDWVSLYAQLLRSESDTQTITLIYEALGQADETRRRDIVVSVMSAPSIAPDFFLWLCRELPDREELRSYANWSFIQLVLRQLASDAMKKQLPALRKLFDADGTVHDLARRLETEQARQLIALLERDSSLEEYRREAILKDLRAWYPDKQQGADEKVFFVTPEVLKTRRDEYTTITTVDIPQNTEEIVKARAHGDLKENFEYHAARARQEMLSSRAKTLHDQLQSARPIDPATVDSSTVCAGTRVTLAPIDGGESKAITILGPWDSDPDADILSYQAPAVAALLGKRAGEQVTFHDEAMVIQSIEVWR